MLSLKIKGIEGVIVSSSPAPSLDNHYRTPFAGNWRIKLYHEMAILELQELTDDDELCRISQRFSSQDSEKAYMRAKAAWVALDKRRTSL